MKDKDETGEAREQMLRAALTCFRRSGFRGASIAEICKEAGVSPGHLYYYFSSKEALIEGVTEAAVATAPPIFEAMAQEPDILSAILDDGSDEADSKAEQAGGIGTFNIEIFAEAVRNDRMMELVRKFRTPSLDLLANTIEAGQARGQIDPQLDPKVAAAFFDSIAIGQQIVAAVHADIDKEALRGLRDEALRRLFAPE